MKWEYKYLEVPATHGSTEERELDSLGFLGWELVSAMPVVTTTEELEKNGFPKVYTAGLICLLKRPR